MSMWNWVRRSEAGSRTGSPNKSREGAVGHGEPGAVVEVSLVEVERAVALEVDDGVEDLLRIFRLAVRREPHDLVLTRIDFEAQVVGEGGVEQADRVREVDLL